MSESKYNDAWKKGFDSGVESQRQSCLFNCDKDFDEFAEGYNQALDDFRKLANEHLYDDEKGDFAITDSSIDEIIGQLKK